MHQLCDLKLLSFSELPFLHLQYYGCVSNLIQFVESSGEIISIKCLAETPAFSRLSIKHSDPCRWFWLICIWHSRAFTFPPFLLSLDFIPRLLNLAEAPGVWRVLFDTQVTCYKLQEPLSGRQDSSASQFPWGCRVILFFESTLSISWTFIAWKEDSKLYTFPRILNLSSTESRTH